jgi:hypothetical protein
VTESRNRLCDVFGTFALLPPPQTGRVAKLSCCEISSAVSTVLRAQRSTDAGLSVRSIVDTAIWSDPSDFAVAAGVRKIPSALDAPVTTAMVAANPSGLCYSIEPTCYAELSEFSIHQEVETNGQR